jgi:hypothetical protein
MQDIPFEWWLRPVRMQARVGEQSAVVCMLLNSSPCSARASMFGVLMGLP